jgi:hypothetical protein
MPFVKRILNTMKNETTGYSAFELVFGRTPVSPLDVTIGLDGLTEMSEPSAYSMATADWLEKAREVAREKVNKTHDKEVPQFNAKRSDRSFEVGDPVLKWPLCDCCEDQSIKLQNITVDRSDESLRRSCQSVQTVYPSNCRQ